MKKLQGQQGDMNVLLVPVILLAVFFVGAASFAVWAYEGRQDYKNHSDAKAAVAVAAEKLTVQAADAKQYAEAAKQPLKPFIGPEAYGSVKVMYPKTWSLYVNESGGYPIDAYLHEDYVPASTQGQTYNLRIRVVTTSYAQVLSQYAPFIKVGTVTATPYSLPKVPDVAGMRLDGAIDPDNSKLTGEMILMPIRDKTLQIWTQSAAYMPDFTNYILPNMTFAP